MQVFEVRNTSKSVEELLNPTEGIQNGFIHRKNKSDKVRFNPKFKEFVGEQGIAFGLNDDSELVLMVHDNYAWKAGLVKSANQKAETLTAFIDHQFHTATEDAPAMPVTNRYSLIYDKEDEKYGHIFLIVPGEEVAENVREITEEQRARLTTQLAKGRITRDQNKANQEARLEQEVQDEVEVYVDKITNSDPNIIGEVSEENTVAEISFEEPNVVSTSVEIG